ncbi:MAG: hypothetical protein AB8I69_08385, partial [Anaerolineae bacterium]
MDSMDTTLNNPSTSHLLWNQRQVGHATSVTYGGYRYPLALSSSALRIAPPAAPRTVLCERAT